MADLSITAANVAQGTRPVVDKDRLAGETLTAGAAVYVKSSDDRYWLAQNDGTAAQADAKGYALNGAAAGQPVHVQKAGQITIGATTVAGRTYCVSDTAGATCVDSDVTTGRFKKILGVGLTTAVIEMTIGNTAVAVG